MTRKLLAVLVLLSLATSAFARTRAIGTKHPEVAPGAGTVSGIVTSVSGNLIHLAGGLVTIDGTGAKIIMDRGQDGTVAQIQPGMLVFAALKSNEAAAGAALPAAMVTVTRFADVTLFGAVQAVSTSSFTLLGRTIHVTNDTSFGGVGSIGELLPNHIVQVQADETGGKLVAASVLVVSRIPTNVEHARGTVKSIASDSWVIARENESDLTLVVNAQTKIAGSPKVGDHVEVLYTVDSAHANVAISIVKFELPKEPPNQDTLFHGEVVTMEPFAWTLKMSDGNLRKVLVNERTKIQNGITVGDVVEVLAIKDKNGDLVALAIVKRPF